jgi:hypothetical protein
MALPFDHPTRIAESRINAAEGILHGRLANVASDFNISPRAVGSLRELYGHHGYDFLHLKALLHQKSDIFWADAYKRFGGKFVISGDCRIAYKPHEAIALYR